MRRPLVALLTTALLVAACGGSDDGPSAAEREQRLEELKTAPVEACDRGEVDHVAVSGPHGERPTIDLDGLVAVEATQCAVLIEGEGPQAAEGDILRFHFTFVNGRTGEEYASSFESVVAEVPLDERPIRGLRQALTGAQAGSRIVVAASPEDGYALTGADPEGGLEEDDTLVMVIDVLTVQQVLPRAEGKAVTPPEGLPTVRLAPSGRPSIVVPAGEAPPAELVVQTLIEGTGAVVQEGQEISAHYVGALWSTGTEFQSSWETAPIASKLQVATAEAPEGLIAGWVRALAGKAVGSQVLMIVPPADAYGPEGLAEAGIPADETLVFVVDLLAVR